MARVFENPTNGYRETLPDYGWAWCLLFGVFYLAAKGLWIHVLVFLSIVITAGVVAGPLVMLVGPGVWIFYAFSVDGILSSKYLKNGWREVTGTMPQEQSSPVTAELVRQKAQPTPKVSAADELRALAELRDKGILTPLEFDAQKAKVLSRP